MWKVLKSLVSRDDPPPDRALQLMRRALYGVPLGKTILMGVLNQLRRAQGAERLAPVRMGLLRLVLNDQISNFEKGQTLMNESLDPGQDHAAYLCGRLLAMYDGLQYAASGDVGVTVADRYYSLAATHPQIAFPKIVELGLRHMRKLRRDNRGAAIAIERDIQDVLKRIEADTAKFPTSLSLEGQGRFALGFHHQRGDSMARAREKKQQKQEGEQQ